MNLSQTLPKDSLYNLRLKGREREGCQEYTKLKPDVLSWEA